MNRRYYLRLARAIALTIAAVFILTNLVWLALARDGAVCPPYTVGPSCRPASTTTVCTQRVVGSTVVTSCR